MIVIDTSSVRAGYMVDETVVCLATPEVCRERLWATWLCGRCLREQSKETARSYTPNVVDQEGDQVGLCPHCAEVAEAPGAQP